MICSLNYMQFAGTSIISFTFYKVQHYFLWVFYASCWVYIIFTCGPWWPLFLMYNQDVEYFKINLLPGFPHTHIHMHFAFYMGRITDASSCCCEVFTPKTLRLSKISVVAAWNLLLLFFIFIIFFAKSA